MYRFQDERELAIRRCEHVGNRCVPYLNRRSRGNARHRQGSGRAGGGAGPTDLPPQARLHRSAPDHRDGRLAVARIVEHATGWSITRFVKALRPCRTITIKAGDQTITAMVSGYWSILRRTAKVTIRTTPPSTTRSSSIWTETSSRACEVRGVMSPKPTVAKTVTVKYSESV